VLVERCSPPPLIFVVPAKKRFRPMDGSGRVELMEAFARKHVSFVGDDHLARFSLFLAAIFFHDRSRAASRICKNPIGPVLGVFNPFFSTMFEFFLIGDSNEGSARSPLF